MTYKEYKNQTDFEGKVREIISTEGLKRLNRKQYIVHQRYFLMAFLRQNTKLSLTDIGNMFERNHATVINGINQHENLIQFKDKVYRDNVKNIKTFLELKEPIPHSTSKVEN